MANLQPSGQFLMDDLFRAGGVLALLSQVEDLFHPEPITVTGDPFVESLVDPVYDDTVILPRERRSWRMPESPCSAAISPREAQSSSPRRRHRNCCSTPALRSSSTRSKTCAPASTTPTLTSRPTRCSCCVGAARGLPRHARGRQHATAAQAARAGCARHGAHLGRPDERHGIRHGHPPRRPRGGHRRPARLRAHWGHHYPRRREPHTEHGCSEELAARSQSPASEAA